MLLRIRRMMEILPDNLDPTTREELDVEIRLSGIAAQVARRPEPLADPNKALVLLALDTEARRALDLCPHLEPVRHLGRNREVEIDEFLPLLAKELIELAQVSIEKGGPRVELSDRPRVTAGPRRALVD